MIERNVVIGCGGLFYHGNASMRTEAILRQRDPKMRYDGREWRFADGDVLEESNLGRQAIVTTVLGPEYKADLAETLFEESLERAHSYRLIVLNRDDLEALDMFVTEGACRLVVYALVDNDRARALAYAGCLAAAAQPGRFGEVWYVTGGNSVEGGQAWGESWATGQCGGPSDGVLLGRHGNELEIDAEGTGDACGEQPEQSTFSNMMTCACIERVLADLRDGDATSEWYWDDDSPDPEEHSISAALSLPRMRLWKEV